MSSLLKNRTLLTGFDNDMSSVIAAAENFWSAAVGSFMSNNFVRSTDPSAETCEHVTNGTVHRSVERLGVADVSARILQALSVTMSLITCVLFWLIPGSVVSSSPDSVAFAAAISSRSPRAGTIFEGSSLRTSIPFHNLLAKYLWSTQNLRSGLSITAEEVRGLAGGDRKLAQTEDEGERGISRWYTPWLFKPWGKVLVIGVPATFIAVMEVLLHVSDSGPGICNVADGTSDRYAWTYIPTIALWLAKLVFVSLVFEVVLVKPFASLATGKVRSRSYAMNALLRNHASDLAIVQLIRAGRYHSLSMIMASLIALGAPFLTIFSAGLYSPSNVFVTVQTLKATPQTWFNTTKVPNFDNSDTTGLVPGLVTFSNMSFPRDTYDGLALPSFELGNAHDEGRMQLRASAYRARVRCFPVDDFQIHVYPTYNANDSSYAANNMTNILLSFNSTVHDPFVLDWRNEWDLTTLEPRNISLAINHAPEHDQIGFSYIPLCPRPAPFGEMHVAMCYLDPGRVLTDVHVQTCRNSIEVVDVVATYEYPAMTVIDAIVDESSARFLANGTDVQPEFFDITSTTQSSLALGLYGINDAIVRSPRWGSPFDELLTDEKLLSQSLEHLIQVYWAQTASASLRTPVADLEHEKPYYGFSQKWNGTVFYNNSRLLPSTVQADVSAQATRLVQSMIATRLLEVLLAVFLIGSLVIFWRIPYRMVVPKQLGSLAVTFSLLAGSDLQIPSRMEFWNAKEMRRNGVWENAELSLRYREDRDGKRDYRVDIDKKVA